MAQQVTDAIQHFIAYLHQQDLLNLAMPHYWGAPELVSRGYQPDMVQQPQLSNFLRGGDPEPVSSGSLELELPPGLYLSHAPFHGSGMPHIFAPKAHFPDAKPAPELPALSIPLETNFHYTAHLVYNIGGSYGLYLNAFQQNQLNDNDIVLGDLDLIATQDLAVALQHQIEADTHIEALVAATEEIMPEGMSAFGTGIGDGLEQQQVHTTFMPVPDWQEAGDSDALQPVSDNGFYQNGEQQSDSSQDIGDHLEQIGGWIDIAQAREDEPQPETSSPQVAETQNFSASGGAAQITTAGGNHVVNAAIVQDYGDVYGSSIVLGDYYETNAIAQINVFAGFDQTSLNGIAVGFDVAQSGDHMLNEASFGNLSGEVYGDVALGGLPFAPEWQVDVVEGDYFDVSRLTQQNLLSDNDINFGTPTQSHSTVVLGENGQLNLSVSYDLGEQYDLIIVAGDYHTYNGIFQINVLYDADILSLVGGSNPSLMSVDGGGNLLVNDAAIESTGGLSYKPLSEDAAQLAKAIGNQETEIGSELFTGLPMDGDGVMNVLYIAGDYFNVNMIEQINIVSDADYSADTMAGLSLETDQSSAAGDNVLVNAAAIVAQDSTSDYQFLGGDVFSETLLVQGNFIENENGELEQQVYSESGLHEDVLATIAAMSQSDDGEASQDQVAPSFNYTGADAEVMGHMMS